MEEVRLSSRSICSVLIEKRYQSHQLGQLKVARLLTAGYGKR